MQFPKIVKSFRSRLNLFGDYSSLHGMRYILSTQPINLFKRLFWLHFVGASAIGMFYILKQSSNLFENEAISFVPETTHLHWNTDFPAITICETVDYDKLIDFYDDNHIPVQLMAFYKEVIFLDSQHYCRSCSDCNTIKCPENFLAIMNGFRSPCNETLHNCSWRDQSFDCCERFMTMLTEFGQCFVFNSALFAGERMHLSNKETGPGYLKFRATETVTIDVHSPDDVFFSNFDKQIINGKDGDLPFASEFNLRIKIEETSNEAEVLTVVAKKRGCLFGHELPTVPFMFSRYSYSTCIVHCRALRQLAECNCTHYMLPRMGLEPTCDIKGLVCLTNLKEKSNEDDQDVECECLPSCEEPKYDVVLLNKTPNTGALTDELIERGTLISIYIECIPTTRIRRLVVRSPLDHVGGTAGIFFGASILSVLEIVYLLFIRKYH